MRTPKRVGISEVLRRAIRTSGVKQYRLARHAGVDRSVLSCWMNDITRVWPGDPRVVKLGSILKVPESECFDDPEASEELPAPSQATQPTRRLVPRA